MFFSDELAGKGRAPADKEIRLDETPADGIATLPLTGEGSALAFCSMKLLGLGLIIVCLGDIDSPSFPSPRRSTSARFSISSRERLFDRTRPGRRASGMKLSSPKELFMSAGSFDV